MQIFTKCKKCFEKNEIKPKAPSRAMLEDEKGRYFTMKCMHCKSNEEYHVNEVVAESSRSLEHYIMLGICLIFTILIFAFLNGFVGLIFLMPLWFGFKFLKEQEGRSVTTFNKFTVSRTRTK